MPMKRKGNFSMPRAKRRKVKKTSTIKSTLVRGTVRSKGGSLKPMTISRLANIVMQGKQDVVVRMDRINTEDQTSGALTMKLQTIAAGNDLPLRAFELSAVPVIRGGDGGTGVGTLIQPTMMFNARMADYNAGAGTNIGVRWVNPGAINNADAYHTWERGIGDSTGWDYLNAGTFNRLWLRTFNIKANLFASKYVPLTYKFEIVRFKTREMIPEQVQSGGNVAESASMSNFWYEYIRPMISGPLSVKTKTDFKKHMVILQSKTVVVPEQPNDQDYRQRVTLEMTHHIDKIYGLDWTNDGGTDTTNPVYGITQVPELGIPRHVSWNNRIRPEQRTYLIVSCSQLVSGANGNLTVGLANNTFASEWDPSIDIVCSATYKPV